MIARLKFYALNAAAFIAVAALVVGYAFTKGRAAERMRQQAANLKAYRTRLEVDDRIRSLSDDDARNRLSRWMRKDGE